MTQFEWGDFDGDNIINYNPKLSNVNQEDIDSVRFMDTLRRESDRAYKIEVEKLLKETCTW